MRGHEGHARAIDHSRVARGKDRHHPYSEDTVTFAQKALFSGQGHARSDHDPETRHLEIIVEDNAAFLAIGKKGQNVRLASKLIAGTRTSKSEEEKRQEIEAADGCSDRARNSTL